MAFDLKELTRKFVDLDCFRRYVINKSLKDSNIYFGQPPILGYLMQNGNCTQAELANALNVSAASMAVSIKRMQKSGLIEKVSDKNDLRCNKISITDEGIRQYNEIKKRFQEIDLLIYDGFSEEELETLSGYIDRMNKNLSGNLPNKKEIIKFVMENKEEKGA